MLSADLLVAVAVLYVAALFGLAYGVDRAARRGGGAWLRSPVVYTLSLSVYCTSWTFYGAVGSAARSGLDFAAIYLGPTLVFVGWWFLLRKLVRIARVHRITSIADLISSRYGKSSTLAVIVTLIAAVATTPYISLQLQALTRSYQAVTGEPDTATVAFLSAAGLAAFTILFGTRSLDANERHHGVVAAIAVEAVVKLVALIAVGVFVVWGLSDGLGPAFAALPAAVIAPEGGIFDTRWAALTFLSAAAILCLPRQFQVAVVENVEERHLATASWLFPLYLFGMSLFILPIAAAGLALLPAGANPDLFVLTLPLSAGREDLALLAFIGGFSSATSMVIVAAIAVSTMVSNHIVMPIALAAARRGREVGDLRGLMLGARRVAIAAIALLGFLYFRLSGGSDALAATGLVAFAGVVQLLPSLLGGLFWRGATRAGALAGLLAGVALWLYTLFLPSVGEAGLLGPGIAEAGPWGIAALRPQALLGLAGRDPLVHALVWSLGLNALLFVAVSALTRAGSIEESQGARFVDVYREGAEAAPRFAPDADAPEALRALAERILGPSHAHALLTEIARGQGRASGLPAPTDAAIARLERELAGSVGAASAHALVTRIAGGEALPLTALMDIADESQRQIETSRQLAEKSEALERAAAALGEANDRLRKLDQQKDAFLAQVSHELRTPMTAIRSFSEILLDTPDLSAEERARFLRIIHEETLRLTRLLDELLDLGRLEAGHFEVPTAPMAPAEALRSAVDCVSGLTRERGVMIEMGPLAETEAVANPDRLRQVIVNLLSNALKYNANPRPRIRLACTETAAGILIDVIDNGGGVSREEAATVFEKFARGTRAHLDQGAGLGLPISRAIMRRMGGDLTVEFNPDGTSFFRIRLARAPAAAVSA